MVNMDDHKVPLGETVSGRWRVIEKLGEGGFGAVYKVVNINATTNDEYAMKVESVKVKESMIKIEAAVLKSFENAKMPCAHICQYVASGGTRKIWFVVMQMVGQDLSVLRRARPDGRFTSSTVTRVGIQALEGVESLHRIGFVHNDLKPSNLAIGLHGPQTRIIFVLDFGLARQYRTPDGELRHPRAVAGFRGTIKYASISAHLHKELGRQDDLWSLLYTMVDLQHGLPWRHETNRDKVLRLKKETTPEKLCGGMEKEYSAIYHDLVRLTYDDTPEYSWYQTQLHAIAARNQYNDSDRFDWECGVSFESNDDSETTTESTTKTKIIKKMGIAGNMNQSKQKLEKDREKEKDVESGPAE